ncbi:MAG: metallophosphoesterase family protein [Trueperaceae bacterium]
MLKLSLYILGGFGRLRGVILGIISDVHANVVALEAAIGALKEKGATTIICLGDLVGYGPSPNETIDLIRQENVMCSLGAADERIAFDFARDKVPRQGVADQTLEWTRTVIEPRHVEFLRTLPIQQRINTPAGKMRFFHGSPDSTGEKTNLNQDPIRLGKLLDQQRAVILACGGTHVPMVRKLNTGIIINPGSVGLSLNGEPGADYVLIKFATDGKAEVEMDKVEYDFAAVAFDIIAWGLPQTVAQAIQQGRMPAGAGG